jgi:hypothetical protein
MAKTPLTIQPGEEAANVFREPDPAVHLTAQHDRSSAIIAPLKALGHLINADELLNRDTTH